MTNLEKKRRMVELGVESLHLKENQVARELAETRVELQTRRAEILGVEGLVRKLETDLESVQELIAETTKRLQQIQSPLAEVIPQGQITISRPDPIVAREPAGELLKRAIEWARGRE